MARSRRRRHDHAQSVVEFALVFPLFLLMLLGTLDAAVWAVETSSLVSSQANAMRVATGADTNAASLAQPSASTVLAAVKGEIRPALFGTRLVACGAPLCTATTDCSQITPAMVRAHYGDDVIALCVAERPGYYPASPDNDPNLVEVDFVGYAASLVPPSFGLGWRLGMIPFDIRGISHAQRYAA